MINVWVSIEGFNSVTKLVKATHRITIMYRRRLKLKSYIECFHWGKLGKNCAYIQVNEGVSYGDFAGCCHK